MKIIVKLVELISEELHDAKRYIKLAAEQKEEHPELSKAFADLAEQEMGHAKTLHAEAARLIEEYRTKVGDPPPEMLAVYNYEHKRQIEKANKIKNMISDYMES